MSVSAFAGPSFTRAPFSGHPVGFLQTPPTRQACFSPSSRPATVALRNEVPLTKAKLHVVLQDLSARLLAEFRHQVRLLVHGGAVMVLHSKLGHRASTRDVDYVHRAFAADYARTGSQQEAEARLWRCIAGAAAAHGLGTDWMNAAPDVALPMAQEYLVRYEKDDPRDVKAMIRMLYWTRGGRWDASHLERWITTSCWPMGYSAYGPPQREQLRQRIDHAVRLAHSRT
ncbi:hypothetical protein OF83DRAFT_1141056 [Amylostereum chailletii]|nr:hypothetical protein OF83DRAFT_1141056 [Amylostereum chailletii]